MKTKMLLVALFAMTSFCVNAQTESSDYSNYLNDAMKKLEAGDCKGAQAYYNIYKELFGKSVSSIENMLNECNRNRVYIVGETMMVNNVEYQVAYIRDEGKHGLAIRNIGWTALYRGNYDDYYFYVNQKGIPTYKELKLIYANRDVLRLYDTYWSCTGMNGDYKVIDFSTGKTRKVHYDDRHEAIVLLIYRF